MISNGKEDKPVSDFLHVIVNKNSGTVLRLGEETVTKMLYDALGERIHSFHMIEGSQMCGKIDRLTQSDSRSILIGGGDGSATCAAELLQGSDVHFGVLPLGTMNLLAQDLGSAPTFEETMARFKTLKEDTIDMGLVNGRMFLCSAVVGLVPESAVVREEIRETGSIEAAARFMGTIAKGMVGSISQDLFLRQSEHDAPVPLNTTSLIISNNRFTCKPEDISARFARDTLKDGYLAVYSAAPKDIIDGLRLLMKMWQGQWQDDQSVIAFETPELIVDAAEKEILVSLDGEPVKMHAPLKFKLHRQSLSVLRLELSS